MLRVVQDFGICRIVNQIFMIISVSSLREDLVLSQRQNTWFDQRSPVSVSNKHKFITPKLTRHNDML